MPYSSRANIETLFGVANVEQWADLDNDRCGSKIRARINEAIIQADEEVDMALRDGPYDELPLDPVPEYIKKIAATLAGVNLFEARGVGQSLLVGNKAWAQGELVKLKEADKRLDADVVDQTPTVVDIPRTV